VNIPWLDPFRTAVAADASGPLVMALATVDAQGDPRVRSVVCRRVDEQGRIWITSDARSAKHRQLIDHPRASAVAWLPAARQQFRFSGTVEIIDSSSRGNIRSELWQTLSAATRATFFWPAPGAPRNSLDAFLQSTEASEPPACFEIMRLDPFLVERLVLGTHPHQRTRWDRSAKWAILEINP
jgi:pyridoxamine 5'-phosphate oxidase